MAAGLSLDPANFAEFQRGLDREVAAMLESAPPAEGLAIEAELPLEELTLERAADFERLAPFGQGNPSLVFASRNLAVKAASPVGRGGEHLLVTVETEGGKTARAIWWQGGSERMPEGRFDLAYSARTSNFKGRLEVQIEWIDARTIAAVEVGGSLLPGAAPQSIDLRAQPQPEVEIRRRMSAGEACVIWAENAEAGGLPGINRLDLAKGETLVVWTAPASDALLDEALRKVTPKKVVWVCRDPRESGAQAFLNRLAGLVKYALKMYGGRVSIEKLAAVCGQRADAVLAGIEVLAGQGWIKIVDTSEAEWQVAEGGTVAKEVGELGKMRLSEILGETAAFRAFLRRAEVRELIDSGEKGVRGGSKRQQKI
jgi:single-stranded-DNA-specific exonuclease